jgi:hypothetical protein
MRKVKVKPVDSAQDIPTSFATEDEERQWWAEHELTDKFFTEAEDNLETRVSNLELQVLKLTDRVDCLIDENQALREQLEQLEPKARR